MCFPCSPCVQLKAKEVDNCFELAVDGWIEGFPAVEADDSSKALFRLGSCGAGFYLANKSIDFRLCACEVLAWDHGNIGDVVVSSFAALGNSSSFLQRTIAHGIECTGS